MATTETCLDQALTTWLQENSYSTKNLDQKGQNGDSALMKITRTGNLAWIKALLSAGVDVNLRNDDGNNALWFACFGNFDDAIDLLIAAQIDIDNQNDNGATALMYAASSGKANIVQQLLKHGANPKLQNFDDFTALDFASTQDVWRILKDAAK